MFPQCSCVCVCLSPEQTLLARCLGYLLTEFDQTFTTNGLFGKDERIKFRGHGHGGSNMPKCTFWSC